MNQRSGRRFSAAHAFLDPVQRRSNLTVITEAHTQRILFDGKRATGVDVRIGNPGQGGQAQTFSATAEVILAAGSIGSPQLLNWSGVGSADELSQLEIPVLHNLQGVGKNLQDHLQIRTIYAVSNTVTLNQRAKTLWGKAMMGLEYFIKHTGPLTMPPSQLGAFARSDDQQESANI